MTELTITPNLDRNTAKFKGAVAAGEHVNVVVKNAKALLADGLRFRVVAADDPMGRSLARFPVEDGDAFSSDDTDIRFTLNLNTKQLIESVRHGGSHLMILDNAETSKLWFEGVCAISEWRREGGEDTPLNLDDYPTALERIGERLSKTDEDFGRLSGKVDECENRVQNCVDKVGAVAETANRADANALTGLNKVAELNAKVDGLNGEVRNQAEAAENYATKTALDAVNDSVTSNANAITAANENIKEAQETLTEIGEALDGKQDHFIVDGNTLNLEDGLLSAIEVGVNEGLKIQRSGTWLMLDGDFQPSDTYDKYGKTLQELGIELPDPPQTPFYVYRNEFGGGVVCTRPDLTTATKYRTYPITRDPTAGKMKWLIYLDADGAQGFGYNAGEWVPTVSDVKYNVLSVDYEVVAKKTDLLAVQSASEARDNGKADVFDVGDGLKRVDAGTYHQVTGTFVAEDGVDASGFPGIPAYVRVNNAPFGIVLKGLGATEMLPYRIGFIEPYNVVDGSNTVIGHVENFALETVKVERDVLYVDEAVYATKEELSAISLTPGPQGEQGPKGDKGDKGEPGADATVDGASVSAFGVMNHLDLGTTAARQLVDEVVAPAVEERVGNGTLTIKQGATVKGTFAANQSGDVEVDLDAAPTPFSVVVQFFTSTSIGQTLTFTGTKTGAKTVVERTAGNITVSIMKLNGTAVTGSKNAVYTALSLVFTEPQKVSLEVTGEYPEILAVGLDGGIINYNADAIDRAAYLVTGHYTCLASDTPIAMADGTERRIDALRIGDRVLSVNPDTMQTEPDVVVFTDAGKEKWGDARDEWTFANGTTVTTVNPHQFYNCRTGRMEYIADFKIGDGVRMADGTETALVSHGHIEEKTRHNTLYTAKWNNYFANGILTGNRRSAKWGWEWIEENAPKPRVFSKLKIVVALTKMGRWDAAKAWLTENGLYDLFTMAQDFREDNEYFRQGISALKDVLGVDDAAVERLLEASVAE